MRAVALLVFLSACTVNAPVGGIRGGDVYNEANPADPETSAAVREGPDAGAAPPVDAGPDAPAYVAPPACRRMPLSDHDCVLVHPKQGNAWECPVEADGGAVPSSGPPSACVPFVRTSAAVVCCPGPDGGA